MKGFDKILARITVALFVVSFSLTGYAASDDALMAFSTRGPDHYADGTPVQEGEMYALVWAKNGCEFAGLDMNCEAIDSENNALVVAMPLAKYSVRRGGAHCPTTLFQIDGELAKKYTGGTYALALLDTRVDDGKGGLKPSGRREDLKGWGLVEKSRISAVGGSGIVRATNAGGEKGAATTTASAVPAGEADTIPQPRITGIRVEDGYVHLTVKGTSPRLLYNVTAGSHPGHRTSRRAAQTAKQGHKQADREIELIVPVREDQRFFTVTQN